MKKMNTFLRIACTLLGICAFVLPGCSSSAKAADSPSGVVEKFYAAMNAENYQAAADCLYYEGKDVEKDKKMMTELLSTYLGPQLKQLGGVKISGLTEEAAANGEVTVRFEMKNGQGQGGPETAKCLKDASGAWKMRAAF